MGLPASGRPDVLVIYRHAAGTIVVFRAEELRRSCQPGSKAGACGNAADRRAMVHGANRARGRDGLAS